MAKTQMASAKTHLVRSKTEGVSVRERVAFDGGNRFIKWFDAQGNPRKVPSYVKEFQQWDRVPTNVDDDSVVIECEGSTFAIGQLAKDLGGVPTFERDKNELARALVLVAFEPDPGIDQILIEDLAIATPDTGNSAGMSHLKKLERTRTFTRNGRVLTAMVRKVTPIDEGLTAWRFAYNKGIFEYQQNNAVLDLGGGTGIGAGRDNQVGRVLLQPGELVNPRFGEEILGEGGHRHGHLLQGFDPAGGGDDNFFQHQFVAALGRQLRRRQQQWRQNQ